MFFSSLIFIYAFLPASLLCNFLCRSLKAKNTALLLFSLIFFAWAGPRVIFPLFFLSLSSWFFALRIERAKNKKEAKFRLFLSCAVDICMLCFFKYAGPVSSLFTRVPGFLQGVALPLGVSFYTFRLITYVADVYREQAKARKSFADVLLFASLFHLCVAGPVVRYKLPEQGLFKKREDGSALAAGISRFSVGLAKKTLLATPCGALADALLLTEKAASDASLFASNLDALTALPVTGAWLGVLAYTLQIYLDFSAYSDMAVGMGKMFGLNYPENFDHPYISRSVTEFWRRWHISLGTFFREHVYIPLGGQRRSAPRNTANLFIVWALTGMWHGATLNFVVWGLWSFLFIFSERIILKRLLEKSPAVFSHIYLLAFVFAGWIIFRFTDLRLGLAVFAGLFGAAGNPASDFASLTLLKNNVFLLAVCVAACTPLAGAAEARLSFFGRRHAGFERLRKIMTGAVIPAALLLLSTASLVADGYSPFIYFQF
ncbi:MAG: MBOAT family protein [Oscillospiraceae bacterium]|nr:MBOAT family protein [Oscillospiraceae bacterium]